MVKDKPKAIDSPVIVEKKVSNKKKATELKPKTVPLVKNRKPINIRSYDILTLGIDPGSGTAAFAVTDKYGNVFYQSQVTVRNDVESKMTQRRMFRRSRRNRKTRYRKPRFLNRASSRRKGRLPPTLTSKVWSHEKEVLYITQLFPIKRVVLEKAKFDVASISNGRKLKTWEYQKGDQYGYETLKAYVRERDSYTCQRCKAKGYGNKAVKLEVHHILERSRGGTNVPSNLITLCKECHEKVHEGTVELKKKRIKSITRHATHTDIIVSQLRRWMNSSDEEDNSFSTVEKLYIFGARTAVERRKLELEKSHANDAITLSLCHFAVGKKTGKRKRLLRFVKKKFSGVQVYCDVIYKRCLNKGDYKLAMGAHSEKQIPVGKVKGFRKFDEVRFNGQIYWIKGKRSSGYFTLQDFWGATQHLKPMPKSNTLVRLKARKSWIVA